MPFITITDRGDGSGVDVRIIGLTNPIDFHHGPFGGNNGGGTLPNVVPFTANGTQTIAVGVGPHQAVAIESGSPIGVFHFRATDGDPGTHYECLEAVRDYIIALALPGFPADPTLHKTHKKPWRSVTEFIQSVRGQKGAKLHGVHYWMTEEERRPAYNTSENVTLPIQIVLMQSDSDQEPQGPWTKSREILARALRATALPAVPDVHMVNVRPMVLQDEAAKENNVDLQSMLILCETQQCQGVT